MKLLAFASLFLLISAKLAFATGATERTVTVDPTFDDGGDCWRPIQSDVSTNSVVIISSAPSDTYSRVSTNTVLGAGRWRKREIINVSNGGLFLQPTPIKYQTYISSFGVNLSSDSKGLGYGDSWETTHQGSIAGLWQPGTVEGTKGAGGYEQYYLPNCKE